MLQKSNTVVAERHHGNDQIFKVVRLCSPFCLKAATKLQVSKLRAQDFSWMFAALGGTNGNSGPGHTGPAALTKLSGRSGSY